MPVISHDPDMWDAAVKDAAQYIARGYLHTKKPPRTDEQTAAHIRRGMYAVLAITDLAWTDADIEKIAAEAKQMADQQMGRNTNWDEWAFGH